MKRFLAAILLVCALLTARPVFADSSDIAAAGRGVVRVVLVTELGDEMLLVGHGSGFAVSAREIVTNAHVVKSARQVDRIRIAIVPPQGEGGWFAEIVAYSPRNDLALLRITEQDASLPPLTLYTAAVGDGADVFAVGYPGNVDQAQGLSFQEIVSPTSPVKTRGNISTGRSAREFSAILHTAPIGSGNSGGPLLDGCGRVIGVNSFGTVGGAADSEFYFAVAMQEIVTFLRKAGVQPRLTGFGCRSIEDVERTEAGRATREAAASEEVSRANLDKQRAAIEAAKTQALLAIIADRESGLALALVFLMLAMGSAGAAYVLATTADRPQHVKIAGGIGGGLILAAALAWFLRPGFAEVESRTQAFLGAQAQSAAQAREPVEGAFTCVLEPERSRLTISDPGDLTFDWDGKGCAGTDQFGLAADGWTRLSVPAGEETVSVARFDPLTGLYRIENYFLDLESMDDLRKRIGALPAPACGFDEQAARRLAIAQEQVISKLPPSPNERLVYDCRIAD